MESDVYNWTFLESRAHMESKLGVYLRAVTRNSKWKVTSIDFIDSYGTTWRRDEHGLLTELRGGNP